MAIEVKIDRRDCKSDELGIKVMLILVMQSLGGFSCWAMYPSIKKFTKACRKYPLPQWQPTGDLRVALG
jgi:hypothetical protein